MKITAHILCLALLWSAPALTAEEKPKPDYSQEAYVIEKLRTAERFENDGTGRREFTAVVRIQTESGVEEFGQLQHGYNSANESAEIGYVRVHKPDGSVVTAGPDAVQDLTAPVARVAPAYTDYHQKHVTVPGLRPGDRLEYQFIDVVQTPFAPGQFWSEHDFDKKNIVLDEEYELNIPRDRAIKLKTAETADAKITVEGDRRIYSWHSSNLTREDEEGKDKDKAKKKKKLEEPKPPAVQFTTFPSWEELGKWYSGLEKERRVITPEIRAKAGALTAGRTTDLDKIEALYDFVAKNYRYVSLSFGLGRYQPHAAAEVLANDYGDCKDKHTLLATLLEASGFHAGTVLIHHERKLDPDLPSPYQFDHVFTMVALARDQIWMDTTAEVAPFRMLLFPLRDKQALLIPPDGAARLVTTPADPPVPNFTAGQIDGQISDLGKFTRHVKETLRGDNEVAVRMILRHMPEAQWKEIAEYAEASRNAVTNDITGFKASDPDATREPLVLEYTAATPNYLDWSARKVQMEVPTEGLTLPAADEDDDVNPVKLGPPSQASTNLRVELPAKYTVRLPLPISVSRDYAEYKSEYRVEDHTVIAIRSIAVKVKELPADRSADYRAFRRSVLADLDQKISLESKGGEGATPPETAKVDELYESAAAAAKADKWETALELYKRVVVLEPKHKYAWNNLGLVQRELVQNDDAIASFKKAIEVNPYDEWAYNNLGLVLWTKRDYDAAAAAFRKQLEVNPLDHYAHSNLGRMFLEEKKYAEALPELEKAASLTPDNAYLKVAIGQAQLNLGNDEKALEAFDQAVEAAATPLIWNDIAYELSLKNTHLDRAQQYAESAVSATVAVLRNLTLDKSGPEEVAQEDLTSSLASYWDTLGWIYFQRGDLKTAERYISPAWEMTDAGEVGDHLGQISEKRGDKAKALEYYAMAMATAHPIPETRGRLAALAGGDKKVEAEVARNRDRLSRDRTIDLGKLLNEEASAEFALLMTPGPKVETVLFLKGSEKLKPFAEALRTAHYHVSFPDDSALKLVRHGILMCSRAPGNCSFVLLPTERQMSAQISAAVRNPAAPEAAPAK
jgi:tetratricopeptide (TPR) repeat protein